MKSKLSFGEQIQLAYRKAKKEQNFEAMAYYADLTPDIAAMTSFESFKGSWAYHRWIKLTKTITKISELTIDAKRYSWHF